MIYSALQCAREISRSSIFFPFLSCAPTQRGRLPRPDQVSKGRSGFRYFGCTFGYGRRGFSLCSLRPLSRAKRRSSSCFSASNFVESTARIFSCSVHSSLVDIDSRLLCFMTISNHDLILNWINSRIKLGSNDGILTAGGNPVALQGVMPAGRVRRRRLHDVSPTQGRCDRSLIKPKSRIQRPPSGGLFV